MFAKDTAVVDESSFPESFKGRVLMPIPTCKNLIVSLERLAVLVIVLSLMGVRAAFAAAGGFPGRPTPPPPPCISTGYLQEDDTSVGCYFCSVRNAGAGNHHVTIDVRNTANFTESRNLVPFTLLSGHGVVFSSCPSSNSTASDACVVTTDEGTTDALQDLAVVLQFSAPAGEAEGKIFNSCAPSRGVGSAP